MFVEANSRTVWSVVSDPARWAEAYPSWIATIEPSGDLEFWIASSRAGEYFNVYAVLDEPTGTADFELVDELGSSTFFRTRVMPVPTGGCVVTQVTSRLQGGTDDDWHARVEALHADIATLASHVGE